MDYRMLEQFQTMHYFLSGRILRRMKIDYIKKAKQVMNCVLEILIPEQEGEQELPCIHAVTNPVPDKINKCEKKFQMKH